MDVHHECPSRRNCFSCSCLTGDCRCGSVCSTHAADRSMPRPFTAYAALVLRQTSFVLGVLLVYAPIPCIDARVAWPIAMELSSWCWSFFFRKRALARILLSRGIEFCYRQHTQLVIQQRNRVLLQSAHQTSNPKITVSLPLTRLVHGCNYIIHKHSSD
jgi:hypothetical protein